MRLDVSRALVAEGEEFPFEAEISLEDAALLGETVYYPTPAKLQGRFAAVGDTVRVWGNMTFAAASRCFRCLQDATQILTTPFDVFFALAFDPENPDLYVYDGVRIDLAAMAAEAALLALPIQWLCSTQCKGLCPVCGTDLNTNQCTCRLEEASDNPFSALQQLLTKDESEV